ncbi:MAG: hypothetical protein ABI625_02120, partial [bacterium]
PYGDAVTHAEAMARAQATEIGDDIVKSGGPAGLQDKEIVAIVAYIQRLGRDIKGTTTGSTAPVAASVLPATIGGIK